MAKPLYTQNGLGLFHRQERPKP